MSIIVSSDVDVNLVNSREKLSGKIYRVLQPYEAPILHLQRLLVWENVLHSVFFVLFLHIMFWYLFLKSNHLFGIFFSWLLLLIWVDFWKHKLWPEIRAVAPDIDSEWGELNPRLLSLREMCEDLACFFLIFSSAFNRMYCIRRETPGKFCLGACIFSLSLYYVGQKVNGAFMLYLLMLCTLIWPALQYHKYLEALYNVLEPWLVQLHHMLNQRPSQTYEIAKTIATEQSSNVKSELDDEVNEFVPQLDEEAKAMLAKAGDEDSEEAEEEHFVDRLPAVTQMPLAMNPFSIDHQSDSDGDDFGIPKQEIATSANEMANAVTNFVKDGFTNVVQSLQSSQNFSKNATPISSSSSTPVSDYEFIILSTDEELEENKL